MASDDLLLWMDLETTGTDVEKDCIIEIGAVLTNLELEEIGHFEAVVRPTALALGRLLQNDIVREMHAVNGLLDELLDNDPFPQHLVTKDFMGWLLGECNIESDQLFVLAGSGVAHFDRKFIDKYMPQVAHRLRYYSLDIGVIRRAHRWWLGADLSQANEGKDHRAMVDIRCHLTEARDFMGMWRAWQADTEVVDQQGLV